MPQYFQVITIPDDAPFLLEQLGTKAKIWVNYDSKLCLLKIGRQNTGENWAEKVACELCKLLNLPHAHYELAVWKGQNCVLSESIIPENGRLVLANELLSRIHKGYPASQIRKVRDYTFGRIKALFDSNQYLLPKGWVTTHEDVRTAYDVFIGYLMLDAWIANQDRHHENWGVISYGGEIYLAPTYDHAASLGQNEVDENRISRLNTRDSAWHIEAYAKRARSAIYEKPGDKNPLLTVKLFELIAQENRKGAKVWLDLLEKITEQQCTAIFERIPPNMISESGIKFALKLLAINKQRLLRLNF